MIVAIHQPEHLPWLGFLDKARQADRFVLLDHVQYRKQYFQNRNRIRSSEGLIWLTVPVRIKGRHTQAINDVIIDNEGNPRWRWRCLQLLVHCYRKTPFFSRYTGFFEELYRRRWERLVELNEVIIRYLLETFSIPVPLVRSSELGVTAHKSDLNLEICKKVGATLYLSGVSGQEYLDLEKFRREGISVRFQEFHHPVYRQLHEPFVPCLSAVDLLFNHGPRSLDILCGIDVPVLEETFESQR